MCSGSKACDAGIDHISSIMGCCVRALLLITLRYSAAVAVARSTVIADTAADMSVESPCHPTCTWACTTPVWYVACQKELNY